MDEFALIRDYFTRVPRGGGVCLGVGDDGAILESAGPLVMATDTLVAGRHFLPQVDPADLGWKSLAVNLSDLAAMGARPWVFTLNLTLPEANAAWLDGFARGLWEVADEAGIDLVGGDTTRGPLSVSVTVLGRLAGPALRREGARPGDAICVSGRIGDAAYALRHPDTATPEQTQRLHRPEPRLDLGARLAGVAHAGIDISDGLFADLAHILEASGNGARLTLEAIPQADNVRALALAKRLAILNGGDDYELCLCLPADRLKQTEPGALTVIGTIEAEPGLRLLDGNGDLVKHSPSGYKHFS